MTTFIGEYICKIDAKGRIMLPAAFKRRLSGQESLVIKKDIFEKCLIIYPMDEWERQNKLIRQKLNPYKREHNHFLRGFYKDTAEVALDNNNRILITKRLLEAAEINKEVCLIGQDGKIEIWAKELYDKMEQNEDEFAALAEKIMDVDDNSFN